MKIIRLQAENVKRIRVVEIVPEGSMVQIAGRNGSGKSSVLDAIEWALAGKATHGSRPVRNGEAKALVRLDLGEVVVTRRFTAEGGTSIAVEAANGARFPSPQAMLDQLLGTLTFDPLRFALMPAKAQLEELRKLVPLAVDLDAIDAEIKRIYGDRTDANRAVRALKERLAGVDAESAPLLDTTPIDVSALLRDMESESAHNAEIERARRDQHRWELEAAARVSEAEQLERRAAQLRQEAERLRQHIAGVADLAQEPFTDVGSIRMQIEAAQRENETRAAEARRREERHKLVNDLMRAEYDAEELSQRIVTLENRKRDAIVSAKMPLEGLAFGDGEVLYRGIPFAQASSAEQLRVSVALAMAANPKLRVLRIKDGSLLDDDSLALLRGMAEANDYQVWIERVDTSGRVGIVLEDGAVVAIDGQPVPAPEESPEVVSA